MRLWVRGQMRNVGGRCVTPGLYSMTPC